MTVRAVIFDFGGVLMQTKVPAQHSGGGKQLVHRQSATLGAGDAGASPHQRLEIHIATTTTILIKGHSVSSQRDLSVVLLIVRDRFRRVGGRLF